jgi:hypothetical protein
MRLDSVSTDRGVSAMNDKSFVLVSCSVNGAGRGPGGRDRPPGW